MKIAVMGAGGMGGWLGRQTDVPTPVHCTVNAALKPFMDGGYVPEEKARIIAAGRFYG